MRALSPIEHEALIKTDPSRSPISFVEEGDDDEIEAAMFRLRTRGCVSYDRSLSDDGKRYCDGFTITDLGRLALRVAVAMPSMGAP